MIQTLEYIRGGGGSVKVGTTGTISALMSRELEPAKSASKVPSYGTSVSVSAADSTPRLKPRSSVDESSSSSSSSNVKSHKGPETARKMQRGSHQIPMLADDNISIDGTPVRLNPIKRGPSIVEVVDIKCGNANPITNQLKKLGFSKLSDSIG